MCAFTFVEYSAVVRILVIVMTLAVVASCSAPSDRVAQEALGDAEFKIVVARSGEQAEAQALLLDTPYRFTLEPLKSVYARGDTLRVWVLGYTAEELGKTFPSLAGRGAADIIGQLKPRLGPVDAGNYRAPPPNTVLFAEIDDESPNDVLYASQDWTQIEAAVGLTFILPGTVACPPIGVLLRAYSLERPEQVCLFTRNEVCEWSRDSPDSCPYQSRIFGAAGAIVQQPDGTLSVGSTTCTKELDPNAGDVLGATSVYGCGSNLVAVQAQPLDSHGQPWAVTQGPSINNTDPLPTGQWVSTARAAYVAFDKAGKVELRTVSVTDESSTYGPLQHPVVDRPQNGGPLASSAAPTQVTLNGGAFADSVAPGQCFRRAVASEPITWAQITRRTGDATIDLEEPGISAFNNVDDWEIIGDPGASSGSLQAVPLRFPVDTDQLGRLSLRGDTYPLDLVLHGRARTFDYPPVDRFSDQQKLFSCGNEVSRPANLAGPIIAAPNGYYALAEDGVQMISLDGTPGPLISSEGEVLSRESWTLVRTQTDAGQESILLYRDGTAHVFDPTDSSHDVYRVPGKIVAVLPGPELIHTQTSEYNIFRTSVIQGQLGRTQTYAVPAFDETIPTTTSIKPAAIYIQGDTQLIGYSQGNVAAVLDLNSGLSSGTAVSRDAAVQAIFQDTSGTQIWAAVTTADGSLTMVRIPKP